MSLSRSVILQVALLVERADVAGVQPAVLVDRLAGGLGVVEVAEHHVVAAHQQLAAVVARCGSPCPGSRGRWWWRPVSAESPSRHIVTTTASVMPNAVTTWSIASSSPHPLDQHHRYDGRAGDREPQRRQVALGAAGRVEQRLVERRRAREDGDPRVLDQPHRLVDVEGRDRVERRPGEQTDDDADLVAEGVEERVDHQVAVVLPDPAELGPRARDADGLAVRAHRALGAAGGAGGEQDVGDVVRADRGAGRRGAAAPGRPGRREGRRPARRRPRRRARGPGRGRGTRRGPRPARRRVRSTTSATSGPT